MSGVDNIRSASLNGLEAPRAIQLREEAITSGLRRAVETGGKTAQAAELLATILRPYLAKERLDLLQPLALLRPLACGECSAAMAEVLPQIEQLEQDQHKLRVERATILSAIKLLVAAAREEDKSEHVRFIEQLLFRSWLDESVFIPLAILIGRYIRLHLNLSVTATETRRPAEEATKVELPPALQLSHARLSATLAKAMRTRGQTMIAAEVVGQLLEPHLHREDKDVLRILGLLDSLTASGKPGHALDISEWNLLEPVEQSLEQERIALVRAVEKLSATAKAEGADQVVEFAERLLLRLRLDEEVFYPAALLIRDYLNFVHTNPSPAPRVS